MHNEIPLGLDAFNPDFIWNYCWWDWPTYKDTRATDDAFFLFLAA